MNIIISIGFTGIKKCYLNITKPKAIEMFCESEGISVGYFHENYLDTVKSFEFENEFNAYDIWE